MLRTDLLSDFSYSKNNLNAKLSPKFAPVSGENIFLDDFSVKFTVVLARETELL